MLSKPETETYRIVKGYHPALLLPWPTAGKYVHGLQTARISFVRTYLPAVGPVAAAAEAKLVAPLEDALFV